MQFWKIHRFTEITYAIAERSFIRHAAVKISLTLVEVRQPRIVLSLVLFVVIVAALHGAETRRAFRTGLRVTDFVASPLTYAELSAVCGLRMIALPLDNRNPGAASSRALAP